MSKIADGRAAVAGEIFFIKGPAYLCRVLLGTDESGCCEVFPKSEGSLGQWICVTCCKVLENQFMKDVHCARPAPRKSALVGSSDELPKAKHVLAWRSFVSGKVEEP